MTRPAHSLSTLRRMAYPTTTQDLLPDGWPAFPGGCWLPAGSQRKVSGHPLLLPQASPGALYFYIHLPGTLIQVLKDGYSAPHAPHRTAFSSNSALRPSPGRMTGFQFVTVEAGIIGRGASESFLGEVLAQRPRSSYILATKVYFPMSAKDRGLSRAQILKQIDASLERLRVDYVDLDQCHRYDTATPIDETIRALSDVVSQGKARYIGFSEWTPRQIEGAFAVEGSERFVSSQPQYSLLWRRPEEKIIPLCAANGISQIVWSPLAQGVLSGKYMANAKPPTASRATSATRLVILSNRGCSQRFLKGLMHSNLWRRKRVAQLAQFSLAWVLREPNVASAIVGASQPKQLEENVLASGLVIDRDLFRRAEAIVAGLRRGS
jgi:aryl-alcohol dehydrogenase-like predicted oxidoreductase